VEGRKKAKLHGGKATPSSPRREKVLLMKFPASPLSPHPKGGGPIGKKIQFFHRKKAFPPE